MSGIRKCERNPQNFHADFANLSGFRKFSVDSVLLFITEFAYEQLKARGGIFDLLSMGTRNLNAKGLF